MPTFSDRDRAATTGGRFRFVTIQERPATVTKDPSGTPIDGPWTTLVEVMPAEQYVISGRERFDAQQLTAPYDTRWKIHYRADMDPDLVNVTKLRRIVYEGRTLNIVFAKQLGRRVGIELQTFGKAT